MPMFMHDHEVLPPGGRYCPLMREVCRNGWTPMMGEDEKKNRPVCISWRPVTVMVGGPGGQPKEVHDCTVGWLPDLMVQVAQESYQGAAATEQARNHIASQAGVFKNMGTAFMALARKGGVTAEDINKIEEEQRHLELKNADRPALEKNNIDA